MDVVIGVTCFSIYSHSKYLYKNTICTKTVVNNWFSILKCCTRKIFYILIKLVCTMKTAWPDGQTQSAWVKCFIVCCSTDCTRTFIPLCRYQDYQTRTFLCLCRIRFLKNNQPSGIKARTHFGEGWLIKFDTLMPEHKMFFLCGA